MNNFKIVKAVSVFVCITLMMTLLVSCSLTKEKIAGTYTGSYTYNGNDFYVVIDLYENGKYSTTTRKNGQLSSSERGEYEIDGRKVKLYMSDMPVYHGSWTEYKYSNGTLKNGGHKFSK